MAGSKGTGDTPVQPEPDTAVEEPVAPPEPEKSPLEEQAELAAKAEAGEPLTRAEADFVGEGGERPADNQAALDHASNEGDPQA